MHTGENSPIGGQEAILETLVVLSGLEGVLLLQDLVDVFAGEERYFVTSVAIKNTKEGELFGMSFGIFVGRRWHDVEDSRVGVFHADTPALHGRDTVEKTSILTLVGSLKKRKKKLATDFM